MFWINVVVTVLAIVFAGVVYVGSKGSFHNFADPSADWYLFGAVALVAALWVLYAVLP